MKNEFMNDFILKQDFETAKRLFFMNGSIMLTHIEEDKFELRTYSNIKGEELDNIIKDRINPNMTRMVFSRFGKIKTDKIKEKVLGQKTMTMKEAILKSNLQQAREFFEIKYQRVNK
jgi:hypothetical protein